MPVKKKTVKKAKKKVAVKKKTVAKTPSKKKAKTKARETVAAIKRQTKVARLRFVQHWSIKEIAEIAVMLDGKKVADGKTVWITTAKPTKDLAIKMGYYDIIENAGAFLVADACCAVAPLKGKFTGLMTDSAKACFYARGKNKFKTEIRTIEQCIKEAIS